jgi:hypothetical protein
MLTQVELSSTSWEAWDARYLPNFGMLGEHIIILRCVLVSLGQQMASLWKFSQTLHCISYYVLCCVTDLDAARAEREI